MLVDISDDRPNDEAREEARGVEKTDAQTVGFSEIGVP
jgi:hypothetical protein